MNAPLLAIRHAATQWNTEKKLQGRRDIPLSQEGTDFLQKHRLRPPTEITSWYCSPLLRSRQTADLLGLDYQIETRLIEMDWGEWESQTIIGLRKKLPEKMAFEEARGLDMQPPGGESPRQVRQRLALWLATLPANGAVGIITHKGVLRALLSLAIGWDLKSKCPLKINWNLPLLFERDTNGGLKAKVVSLDWETSAAPPPN